MSRGRYVLAFLVVVALTAVACRPAGEPYNTPNPDPVCIAAAGLEARVTDLRNLDTATATRDDVVVLASQVRAAWITLEQQARVLAEAEATDMAVQLQKLETAARQLPPGTTPAQAKDLLAEELAAVNTAWQSLQTELGCPDLTASPAPI
jgi:hypothetical protein